MWSLIVALLGTLAIVGTGKIALTQTSLTRILTDRVLPARIVLNRYLQKSASLATALLLLSG